jgi:Lipoprotein LpqB beta-propeller domain
VGRVERRTLESAKGPGVVQLSIAGMRRIAAQLVDVRGVCWSGAGRLTVLGEDSEGVVLPYDINFDGSALRAGESGPGRLLESVAATENQALAGTDDGTVWQLSSAGRWINRGRGREPFYPG